MVFWPSLLSCAPIQPSEPVTAASSSIAILSVAVQLPATQLDFEGSSLFEPVVPEVLALLGCIGFAVGSAAVAGSG